MGDAESGWMRGLQDGLTSPAVSREFRHLLGEYLPMTQERLARQVGMNRATVNKWKKGSVDPSLDQQRQVLAAVRRYLVEIEQQAVKVENMISALEKVRDAHSQHSRRLDQASLDKLTKANERVRVLVAEGS